MQISLVVSAKNPNDAPTETSGSRNIPEVLCIFVPSSACNSIYTSVGGKDGDS